MSPRRTRKAGFLLPVFALGCASWPQAPPEVQARARTLPTWSAELAVSLKGDSLRGGTRALMAFRRPGELRIEVPTPAGLRLVVVTRGGELTAVFPKERAVYEGKADPAVLQALVGVDLGPGEIMDLVVGAGSPRLKDLRVAWGAELPREVEATLPDGTRLKAKLLAPEARPTLAENAFLPPAHEGFRQVPIEEARDLMVRA